MLKAKRILYSIRYKFLGSFKRFTTWSNCVMLVLLLFIAAVVFSLSDTDPNDVSYMHKLDEFKPATFDKVTHHLTVQTTSSPHVKKRTSDVTKAVKNEEPMANKVATSKPLIPDVTPKRLFPLIKVFYRGNAPLQQPNVIKPHANNRNIFDAMAYPRLFPQSEKRKAINTDNEPAIELSNWIQANNPKDETKLLVYSAYWDDRFHDQNIVRIMAVMVTKNSPSVYCRVQLDDGSFNDVPVSKKIMNEHWRLKYASYFLSCELSKRIQPPSNVLVSLNRNFEVSAKLPVYNNKEEKDLPRGDLAVCVKPMHYYYNRAAWMVEFIELHRIFGVEHFFFYNHSVGEDVDALLRHYMKQNIVTVLPWNLPVRSQKEIRTEGIFSSLNDCIYRTMYLFHYVVLLDFDEYIIPREHNNYLEMIDQLEEDNKRIRGQPGSFVFRNVFFYLYWENDTAAFGVEPEKPPEQIPYLITQYKTRRLSSSMKIGSRSKYITVPERVIEVGNHVVWRHTSGSRAIQVPETMALLHHYRICEFGGYTCLKKPNLVDRTAHKFGPELLRRVFEECHQIYPKLKGKCPVSPPLGTPW